MRYYKWSDKGEGRRIGKIGNYCLYEKTITEEECDEKFEYPSPQAYGLFKFVYGPSAGGLLESIKFNVFTDGERIKGISAEPYKTREIQVTGLSVEDALLRIERINAPFTASHSITFLLAVEDALEIEQDYDVQLGRMTELELERIRNHLFVISRLTETASLNVPTYHLLHLVEKTNRLIGEMCGHRYFFGVNSVNDVNCNFEKLLEIVDIVSEFKQIFEGLQESRIFIDRLQSNGKIKDENSIGPAARASSFSYDARKDFGALPYSDFSFKTITIDEADAFGRFLVRGYEVLESSRILIELSSRLREKKEKEGTKVNLKQGEGLARVESPSGDLAYYVKIENGVVKSISFFTPSYKNLSLFLKSVIGTIFTDFQFNWESFGIWISELGVTLK